VDTEDFWLFCHGETRRKEKGKKREKKISLSSNTDTPMQNNREPLTADCDGICHQRLLGQILSAGNQRLGDQKQQSAKKTTTKIYTPRGTHTSTVWTRVSGWRQTTSHHDHDIITTVVVVVVVVGGALSEKV